MRTTLIVDEALLEKARQPFAARLGPCPFGPWMSALRPLPIPSISRRPELEAPLH
jgi:hypothetical protein